MDHDATSDPTSGGLVADVDALGALTSTLTAIGDDVASLDHTLAAILYEIRVAIGTDHAADLFRARFDELGGAATDAVGDVRSGIEAHRDAIRRGAIDVADADADARDAMRRGR